MNADVFGTVISLSLVFNLSVVIINVLAPLDSTSLMLARVLSLRFSSVIMPEVIPVYGILYTGIG